MSKKIERILGSDVTSAPKLREIEGLRAIAVIGVLLFHLDFKQASGGYLGVDVFFVISGFVITRLIRRATEQSQFDYLSFVRHRAARLFPAYFVTIALTLLAGIAVMNPEHLRVLGRSAFASTLGYPNIFFYLNVGYFDLISKLQPLLHLWSLGVEFQFYIFWPFIVTLATRAGKVIACLAMLCLLSFLARLLVPNDQAAIFYLTPFRIFEFIFGAVIVWFRIPRNLGRHSCETICIAALLFLIVTFAMRVAPERVAVVTSLTLLAVLSASALIALSPGTRYASAVLSSEPLVRVGSVSYSLYLVHWPVITIYSYATLHDNSVAGTLLQILIVIASTVALHLFVEQPFRATRTSRENSYKFYAPIGLLSCAMATALIVSDGLPIRMAGDFKPIVPGYASCEYPMCEILHEGQPPKLIIFGDSHAQHLGAGFHDFVKMHHISLAIFHFDGRCRFINLPVNNLSTDYDCPERLRSAVDYVRMSGATHLIFAHRWVSTNVEIAPQFMTDLLQKPEFAAIRKIGLILNAPGLPDAITPQECRVPTFFLSERRCDVLSRDRFKAVEAVNANYRTSPLLNGTTFFDPFDVFCNSEKCRNTINERALYSDNHHLSEYGSQFLVNGLDENLMAFLK